jgi:solute carrier family 25 folate transporter 32
MGPSFLGISHVAIQFPIYEKLKIYLHNRHKETNLTSIDLIFASTLSKLVACTITYPHEVIRTRLLTQTHRVGAESHTKSKYAGIYKTGRIIVAEEGVSGLYKGLRVALVRTLPATALSIYLYEILIRNI